MACGFIFIVSAKMGLAILRRRKSSNTEDAGKKLDRFVPFLRRAGHAGRPSQLSFSPGACWLLAWFSFFGIRLRSMQGRRLALAERFRTKASPFFHSTI